MIEPRSGERPWLLLVVGAVFLFFGLIGYGVGRPSLLWLVGGVGAVLYGVADYLPARWSVITVALRLVVLLSFVIIAVLFVVPVLP